MIATVEPFLFGNRYLDGRWQEGKYLLGGRQDVSLGRLGTWQVSEAAAQYSARSLFLVPTGKGGQMLALRRPVDGGRSGDQTTYGVVLPAEAASRLDALDALRAAETLSPSLAYVEEVSRASLTSGTAVRLSPVDLSHLLNGALPDTAACRSDLVAAVVARILWWWDQPEGSPKRVGAVLIVDDWREAEAYLAAALGPLPVALRRQVTFATLERAVLPEVAFCGLVPGLDSLVPDPSPHVVDARSAGPRPAATDWDQAARILMSTTSSRWESELLARAASSGDLRTRLELRQRYLDEPGTADPDVLAAWVQDRSPLLQQVDAPRLARLTLEYPEAFPRDWLSSALDHPGFAAEYGGSLWDLRHLIDDATLRERLELVGDAGRRVFLTRSLAVLSREEMHPGCAQRECPVVVLFDWTADRDEGFADQAAARGILSPERHPHLASRYALEVGPITSEATAQIPWQDWHSAARELRRRMNPELLADRIAQTGSKIAAEVTRMMLADEETYDFVVQSLMPALDLVFGPLDRETRRAFYLGADSRTFARHSIPRAVAGYATLPDGATPGTALPVPTLTLHLFEMAEDEWDSLARAVRAAGDNPGVVAVAQFPASRQRSYLASDQDAPTLVLEPRLQQSLLETRQSGDVFVGKILPALTPDLAHAILATNFDQFIGLYGLHPEFPPEAVEGPPPTIGAGPGLDKLQSDTILPEAEPSAKAARRRWPRDTILVLTLVLFILGTVASILVLIGDDRGNVSPQPSQSSTPEPSGAGQSNGPR